MGDEAEVPLTGGFSNVVVKCSGTVRRRTGPWTPAVHELLRHLHAVGFTRVPVPHGFDDQGREILSFIDGEVAWWPWPDALMQDGGLREVARMVRHLGAAVSSFNEPADAIWHGGPRTDPDHVIRHGDLAPWNTVWVGDQLTGLIDWDTAEPAPRGWDAAQAAWYFVPLRPLTGYRAEGRVMSLEQIAHRFALWCGEVDIRPNQLLSLIEDVQRFERDRILARGRAGIAPYVSFLERGDADAIDGDRAWLSEHRSRLIAATDESTR